MKNLCNLLHFLLPIITIESILNTVQADLVQTGLRFKSEIENVANNITIQHQPHDNQEREEHYGHLVDIFSNLCIEVKKTQVVITSTEKKTKNELELWFQPCKVGKVTQLWRFDDEKGGKLHTKVNDKKCVQASKGFKYESKVKIDNCNDRRVTQLWRFSKGFLGPLKKKKHFAYSRGAKKGAKKGDFLVLVSEAYPFSFEYPDEKYPDNQGPDYVHDEENEMHPDYEDHMNGVPTDDITGIKDPDEIPFDEILHNIKRVVLYNTFRAADSNDGLETVISNRKATITKNIEFPSIFTDVRPGKGTYDINISNKKKDPRKGIITWKLKKYGMHHNHTLVPEGSYDRYYMFMGNKIDSATIVHSDDLNSTVSVPFYEEKDKMMDYNKTVVKFPRVLHNDVILLQILPGAKLKYPDQEIMVEYKYLF